MAADTLQAAAFSALEKDIDRRLADAKAPVTMTGDQRSYLVNYAEANVAGSAGSAENAARAGVGRVQSMYVAGALGTLDPAGSKNPFRDQQLAQEYDRQAKFMENQNQKLLGRADREPER